MFLDRIKVLAQAGNGGRGSVSFRREKFVPKGGPDGGDGGRGGDVILRADRHVDNLASLFYEPIIKAKNGTHGKGKKMTGRAGADKIVKIPVGTMVWPASGDGKDKPLRPMSPSLLSILCEMGRNSCFAVAAKEGKATCISRARVIARRGNTPTAKRASMEIFYWSCERLRTLGWLVTRMQVNRHCCGNFRPRGQRSRHIRSRHCIRSLA